MFLKRTIVLLSLSLASSVCASSKTLTYNIFIKKRSYNFSVDPEKKVSLKEKSIDLSLKPKKCAAGVYEKFESSLLRRIHRFNSLETTKSGQKIDCKKNLQRQVCLFIEGMPQEFLRVRLQQKELCKKKIHKKRND